MVKQGKKNKFGYEYDPPERDCIVCGRPTSYAGAWKDGREVRVCCKCQRNQELIDFAIQREDRKVTDEIGRKLRSKDGYG